MRWDGGDALAGELRQHALGGRRFQAQWQWHPRLAYCLLHYPVNYLLCRIKVNRALWYASVVYSTSIIMIKPRWILRKGRAWSMCWCHHRAAPCIGIHPWIRLPNPTFCGLPCMIARCAPHLSRVAAGLAPYRVELSSWEGVTGMIWREGHDWFLWIIIPLHWVSLMRPSSIIFLWQNVSPMHSVFLEMTCYIMPCQAFHFHQL